jgi:hypothetical protein
MSAKLFFYLLIFWGLFTRKDHLTHHNVFKYIYFHDSYQYWRLRESNDLEYCYCNLNKKLKNYVLNLVNFSKFEGIPSWIWLLFFGAWFQLFGLFWMVTGFLIFRPLPVLMCATMPHDHLLSNVK